MYRDLIWVAFAGLLLAASGCGGGGDSRPARASSARESSASEPSEAADASQEPAPAEAEASSESGGDAQPASDSEAPAADPGEAKEASLEKLQTIGSALQAYEEQYKHFPPAAICDASGKPLLSWRVALLPLLGEEELYKEFHQDEPWDSKHNLELAKRMPNIYRTPGGPAPPKTCYLVPLGAGSAISQREALSSRDMPHTKGSTALVVEVNSDAAAVWTQPQDWQFVPANPAVTLGKLREGEFCCALANGKSRTFGKELSATVLRALFNATAKKPAELASEEDAPAAEDSPEAKSEEGLLAQAKAALSEGRELDGLKCLMAEAVVRGDGEVLDTLRWSWGLRMPMLAARWGIALQTPAPSKAAGRLALRRARGGDEAPAPEGSEADPARFWREALIQPLVQQLQLRVTGSQFGQWLKGNEQASAESSEAEARWPGIVQFSVTKKEDALKRAEREQLDVLLIVEITPKVVLRGLPQSTLALYLLNVHEPDDKAAQLWPTAVRKNADSTTVSHPIKPRALNSYQVEAAKKQGKAGDPVKELIDELMKYVDENLPLVEMPKISPEAALRRADSLVAEKSKFPLPVLMELRFYERKKLLTTEEVAAHYSTLLGEEQGPQLAKGTEADRLQIVAKWLPKEPKEKE